MNSRKDVITNNTELTKIRIAEGYRIRELTIEENSTTATNKTPPSDYSSMWRKFKTSVKVRDTLR